MHQRYEKCVECGAPKLTYHQQRSPKCNACGGKSRRTVEGGYYTHCIDCGKPQALEHRRYPRCRACAWKANRKHEFFDTCQQCGQPKARTKNRLCRKCSGAKRSAEHVSTVVTYDHCQRCGKEKPANIKTLCQKCSTAVAWDREGRRIHPRYDHCQECGKPKTKNDRELCLSCAGVRRMLALVGNDDREYPIGFDDTLREEIRERDGRRCIACGKNEADNGRLLDVHHINEVKADSFSWNLVSLCQKCHGKTHWSPKYWYELCTEYIDWIEHMKGAA